MQFLNRRGYTIDQTILIVAIIAILITLVIVTLGWTLLSRTSGSKLGTFTDQLTQAVNVFYGSNHVFPGSSATAAMNELYNANLIKFRYDGTNFYHDIGGASGYVTMAQTALADGTTTALHIGSGGSYLVAQFTDVPMSEANEADKAVDGPTPTGGHLIIVNSSPATCDDSAISANKDATGTSTKTTVCFIAQKVN